MKRKKSTVLKDIKALEIRLDQMYSNPLMQPYRQLVPDKEMQLRERFELMLKSEKDKIILTLIVLLKDMDIAELETQRAYKDKIDWWQWLTGEYWQETFLYWLETEIYPNAATGEKVNCAVSSGGKTKGENRKPIYDKIRDDIARFHERSPLVSFTEIRKKVAQKFDISEGAAKKNIKKSDFLDW